MEKVEISKILLIGFLIITIIPALATNLQPTKAVSLNDLFSDHFDGEALDPSKWISNQNVSNGTGGSITVANSYVFLTSSGTSFPVVFTSSNPFPTSGDFAIEFDIEYTRLVDWGTGFWISNGLFLPIPEAPFSNILQIWGGRNQLNQPGSNVLVAFFGKQVYNDELWGNRASNLMIFRLQYSQGIYVLYLNGTRIASQTSSLRADTIGFGHPPIYYLPMRYNEYWTSFKLGSIRLLPLSTLSIHYDPTQISESNVGVNIRGKLIDTDNRALPNAPVVLSYQIPTITLWTSVTITQTDNEGNFEATWFPPATGTFLMKAEWPGDSIYSGTLQCKNISITRDKSESLLLVESNSSLSSLTFNSTSKEISFSVSGESGTNGYARFLVSKTLMDGADLKVFLDGKQLQCNITAEGTFQSLYFQYQHSTHNVLIKRPVTSDAAQPTATSLPSSSPIQTSTATPTLTLNPTPSIPEFPAWIAFSLVVATILILMVFKDYPINHKMQIYSQLKKD